MQELDEELEALHARRSYYGIERRSASNPDHWLSLSGEPQYDEFGVFTGYHGVTRDITKQKTTEIALRKSEARFREFAALAADWFWALDTDLHFIFLSKNVESTGTSREHFIGKTLEETCYEGHDLRELDEELQALKAQRPYYGIERRSTVNPEYWLSLSGEPQYDEAGAFTGYHGTTRDITKQKAAEIALRESEARFREFFEIAADWLWEMDGDMRFTNVSVRFQEITGCEPSHFLGKTHREVSSKTMKSKDWRQYDDDVRNRREFQDFRCDVTFPDGKEAALSVSGRPIFDADGEFLGYRGTSTDITPQKLAERQRDNTLEEVRRASDAKTEFLASMSHELRTPLNAILGFSEILKHEYLGSHGVEKYREYADDIHSSGRHLLQLVNDFLDVSASENEKIYSSQKKFSISEVIDEFLWTVIQGIHSKGIVLDKSVANSASLLFVDERE